MSVAGNEAVHGDEDIRGNITEPGADAAVIENAHDLGLEGAGVTRAETDFALDHFIRAERLAPGRNPEAPRRPVQGFKFMAPDPQAQLRCITAPVSTPLT